MPKGIPTDAEIDAELTDVHDRRGKNLTVDETFFRQSQADGLAIFQERRKVYGSHIESHKRFPKEYASGLYLKCARIVRMIEAGDDLHDDTLLDLANYPHLIRSARMAEQ